MGRLSEKTLHGLAWIVMLAYFSPYLIWGQDLSITIHDNLDSNFVWMKLILEHSSFWSPPDTIIEPIMGGIPLYSLSPVYDLPYLIFNLLGIFNGYVLLRFLMMVVAFYGMRALLRTHIPEFNPNVSISGFRAESRNRDTESPIDFRTPAIERKLQSDGSQAPAIERRLSSGAETSRDETGSSSGGCRAESRQVETGSSSGGCRAESRQVETIIYGVSLCFAILPFWGFNFSVPTLPLLFWALLNIHKGRQTQWDYLAILFVGLTASLVLTTIFVTIGFGLYGLLQWYTHHKKPFRLYGALLLLSFIQVATYWKIIWGTLDPPMGTSHRTEFDLLYLWPGRIFSRTLDLITDGWYHSPSIHTICLILAPVALVLIWKKAKTFGFILALEFILFSSIWYGAVNFAGLAPITSLITNILPIQLQRIHFIQPMAWYLIMAWSLFYIGRHLPKIRLAIPGLILIQVAILFSHHEGYQEKNMPSYRAFYAEALFDEVKTYLGPDESQERCIFISSHPAILQYNGFNTLDGYLANYPLAYKHAFREIIAGELANNETLNHNFSVWGSRAYSMVGSIGKDWIHPKPNNSPSPRGEGWGEGTPLPKSVTSSDSARAESYRDASLINLDYNWQAFQDLGGKYIFSPFPISDSNLSLLKTFDHPESAWTIYLYGLKDE